ncbi:zinc finger domain-containing protein [Actinomycetospora sp. CA-053990]|uniref:zinc finger domain-containing protein n=1 Tax=Actinomycetospora sp. CA-053990 TaxID=3239891 RepID=UPI003D90D3CF
MREDDRPPRRQHPLKIEDVGCTYCGAEVGIPCRWEVRRHPQKPWPYHQARTDRFIRALDARTVAIRPEETKGAKQPQKKRKPPRSTSPETGHLAGSGLSCVRPRATGRASFAKAQLHASVYRGARPWCRVVASPFLERALADVQRLRLPSLADDGRRLPRPRRSRRV